MEDSDEQSNTTAPIKEQKNNTKEHRKKWSIGKKIAVIAGSIVLFIVAILMVVNWATSAPLKVSDEFVSDIQSNRASSAYALMSPDAQAVTDSQDFATVVDQIGPILSGKPNNISREVSAETGSDPTAKVVYEVKGSDNYVYTLTINLVQENSEWKVLNFESVKK